MKKYSNSKQVAIARTQLIIKKIEDENKRLREALEEIFSEYQSLRDARLSLIRMGNTAYEALEESK